MIEDHEIVVDVYSTWPRQNSNTFVFKFLEIKYDLFENPTVSDAHIVIYYAQGMYSIVFRHISRLICH